MATEITIERKKNSEDFIITINKDNINKILILSPEEINTFDKALSTVKKIIKNAKRKHGEFN